MECTLVRSRRGGLERRLLVLSILTSKQLRSAAQKGHRKQVEALLDKGFDIEGVDKSGQSSLFLACNAGHVDCVEILLERGANTEAINAMGATPLMIASGTNRVGCVEMLLKYNANVDYERSNTIGDKAFTDGAALKCAVVKGSMECVKILLDKDKLNQMDKSGSTMIYYAVAMGQAAVMEYLLDLGAKLKATGLGK